MKLVELKFYISDIFVHIVSDSIAKHVSDVRGARVLAFPGINISRLTSRIRRDPSLVSEKYSIFHVGTNDVHNLSVDEIISDFNNLITVVRGISNTKILMSSILPRPVDYSVTGEKVKEVNRRLKLLCAQRHARFLLSFKRFFKFGKPLRELFAVRDGGLHLNSEGIRRLRVCFCNTIAHLDRA
jgi:lysophospholipase L1-like esterase